jgi:hypothetical protein
MGMAAFAESTLSPTGDGRLSTDWPVLQVLSATGLPDHRRLSWEVLRLPYQLPYGTRLSSVHASSRFGIVGGTGIEPVAPAV